MDSEPGQSREAGAYIHGATEGVADLLADVVFELDDRGVITEVTDDVETYLGHEPADVTGTALPELLDSVSGAGGAFRSTAAFRDRLDAGEQLTNLDARLETGGGGLVTATLSVLVLDTGVRCLVQNISEHEPDEPGQTQYGEIVQSLDDPLYVLDETGVVEWVNDAMVDYTGYEREELTGRSITELVPASECSGQQRQLSPATIEDVTADAFETTLVTKEGERILSEVNVTALTDDGADTRMVGTLRDIRGRKRREQDLELLKEVLIRVFRHNVRNELNIVEGHATILDDRVDDTLEQHTTAILDTAEQLLEHSNKARLLEQVIESDGLHEVRLDEVVDRLVHSCRQSYPEATIEVDLSAARTVEAHSHIAAAVEELITNAIEHAPDEKPWVHIWMDETDDALTLFVEDQSGGLEDHEIGVLRQGVEDRLEHSNGVGLWLVRWIVESSGAGMVAHRTDDGSLMGIRFSQRDTSATRGGLAPVTSRPVHVRKDSDSGQLHGEIVVGRNRERQLLEEAYGQLDQTGGHAVFLTGESGFGKSTLVEQFLHKVGTREDPPVIATGRCERGSRQPYQAFRDALTDIPAVNNVPEILEEAADTDAQNPDAVSLQRQSLFTDIADELRTVGQKRTVVLVLEELQWASQGTVALLEYLIDEVLQWSPPVLCLCTCRTNELSSADPVSQMVGETADAGRGTVLELEPFDVTEVERLLAEVLDVETLPAEFVEDVHDHTGGIPLFVAELGRHLRETAADSGEIVPQNLETIAVPETVETAVLDRIDTLSATARTVLEVGAILGQTISFDVLREASELRETELVDAVDMLVDRRLWDRTDGRLRFVHGLVREQTLDAMSQQRRESLHERAADAIESVYDDKLEGQYGQLGTHCDHAGADRKAIDWYRRAGDRAVQAYAHEDAIAFYDQALELAREASVGDETVATLAAELADSLRMAGRHDNALDAVEEGLAVVPDGAAVESRLLGVRARVEADLSRFEAACNSARKQRERASELGRTEDEITALRQLGTIARQQGEYTQAERHLQDGLSLAESAGNRHETASIYKELGSIALRQGEYEQAKATYHRSLDTARDGSDKRVEAACLNNLGSVAMRQGNYEEAYEYNQQSIAIKREIGDRPRVGTSLTNLGLIADRRGQYEQANTYLEESLDIRQDVRDRVGEAHTLNVLGMVARKQDDYQQAVEYIERSRDIAASVGDTLLEIWTTENRGLVAYYRGNHKKARRCFEWMLEKARALDVTEPEVAGLCNLGTLARENQNYDTAREFLTEGHDKHTPDGDPLLGGKLHLERARLELDCGNLDTAQRRADQAYETFAEIEAIHWATRANRVRGDVVTALGKPDDGCAYWREAVERFEQLNAPRDVLATVARLIEHGNDTARWRDVGRDAIKTAPSSVARQYDWLRE